MSNLPQISHGESHKRLNTNEKNYDVLVAMITKLNITGNCILTNPRVFPSHQGHSFVVSIIRNNTNKESTINSSTLIIQNLAMHCKSPAQQSEMDH
jgi:hypothetical protein